MPPAIQLARRRFGRLRVLSLSPSRGLAGQRIWRCVCDCGRKIAVRGQSLLSGRSRSCGCLRSTKTPPRGLLTFLAATRKYGIGFETLKRLVAHRRLDIYREPGFKPLLSDRQLASFSRSRDTRGRECAVLNHPDGYLPVTALARELGISDQRIRHWLRWPSHPALGRRIRSLIGPYTLETRRGQRRRIRGQLIARDDLAEAIAAAGDPLHRRFPGVPGAFVAAGVFEHDDGRLFYTQRYVETYAQRFGIPRKTLDLPSSLRVVERLRAIYPMPGADRWKVWVYSASTLTALRARKEGKSGDGFWFARGVWQDHKGQWLTSAWIAEQCKRPGDKHLGWTLRDVLSRQLVPRPAWSWNGRPMRGAPIAVFHESEALPFVGLSLRLTGATRRRRPSLQKHERWLQWRNDGLSWAQIRQKHEDETGETVTRQGVKNAIVSLIHSSVNQN
jgi:hypothetical protein